MGIIAIFRLQMRLSPDREAAAGFPEKDAFLLLEEPLTVVRRILHPAVS
ncbi:MAG: hypothetical protein ACTXOO_01400 [Sodalis sp. (in: enterobacteria)]